MNCSLWHLFIVRATTAMLLTVLYVALFAASVARAQNQLPSFGGTFTRHHTQAKLILSADTAKPGDTIWVGVDLKMDPGWHTYWKNPGDAGSPTKIEWQLPSGLIAGAIHWPLPEKLPPAEVTTYGYVNEVVLLVPLTLASNLPAGTLNLAAKVSWLECQDLCIPANQNVAAALNVGAETKESDGVALIQSWQRKVPSPAADFPWQAQAWWENSTNLDQHALFIEGCGTLKVPWSAADKADFFPDANDALEFQGATEMLPARDHGFNFILRKVVRKLSGQWPAEISGVLVEESGGERTGFGIKLPVADQAPDGAATATIVSQSPSPVPSRSLVKILLFAFLGGLILNIMPCVLPVIALKILGFVSEARSEPHRVRSLGLIYAAGVLVSFLVLAAFIISVKAAGHHAGWGMQFSSPVFVVCLTTLVTLVALNLFGVFEVAVGGRALDAAGGLASRHGNAGAFFNGVLATTLATPCTAPFLAPALGFAFAQTAPLIVLVFLFVGLGLSAPYVLLSWQPAWLKFLPKPGAWMEKFKIAMGFPMLATVVWLFSVASSTYGKNVLWLGVFLVLLAFAAWIFGEFFQRGTHRRGTALALVVILLAGSYVFALEKELNWRTAMPAFSAGSLRESADGIDWQPWSPEAVAAARAAGKPVLVDFTADWCLTCQVNKKTSIEIPSVRQKIKDLGVVVLLADDTHTPENISVELGKYNRAGVPLVLVYPKTADVPAIVLPEVLTPQIVLNALGGTKTTTSGTSLVIGVAICIAIAIVLIFAWRRDAQKEH